MSINFVMNTPRMAPMGRIPMRIDCAADLSIVIPYSLMRVAMGTEVISLSPYPFMSALREIMRPIAMILAVDFNL